MTGKAVAFAGALTVTLTGYSKIKRQRQLTTTQSLVVNSARTLFFDTVLGHRGVSNGVESVTPDEITDLCIRCALDPRIRNPDLNDPELPEAVYNDVVSVLEEVVRDFHRVKPSVSGLNLSTKISRISERPAPSRKKNSPGFG